MTDKPFSKLAEAIADGREPDWASAASSSESLASESLASEPLAPETLDGYRIVSEIAACFLNQQVKEAASKPAKGLFSWRHLEVVEQIGAGAFGAVYRAYDPVLRRYVALKLAREDAGRYFDPRMVIAEARSLARLRHPNVLAVHGADEQDGKVGIWCDLLRGRTVEALIEERGSLSRQALLAMAEPLADALALVHRRGLAHGDIKPANIMVEADGTPILMDFGAAREPLRSGPVLGSPLYMAPEQFDGRSATPASDIYSFGVLLYVALVGQPPLDSKSLKALERQHEAGAVPDFGPVPWSFRHLLRDMLARAPGDRPEASEVAKRLAAIRTAPRRWTARVAVGVVMVSLTAAMLASVAAYRAEAESRDRLERVKDVMVEAAESAMPTRQSGPTSVKAMYEKLAELTEERLVDYPVALAEMRMVAGEGLGKMGETQRGLELVESGALLMEQVRSDSWRDMAMAWLAVATFRTRVDDTTGAEAAVRKALDALEGVAGEEPAATRLTAMNRLAIILGQQGRWYEEIAATQQLLAERRAFYGENSIRLAVDYHNLAATQVLIGDLEAALTNERRAEQLLLANGDDESVRMGFVQFAIAGMLIAAGQFDEARETLARVEQIYHSNLPAGHRNLEFLAESQARLALETGDFAAAEATFERLRTVPGEEFALTRLSSSRYLAQLRMKQLRWSEARALYEQIRNTRPEMYRPLDEYFDAALAYAAFRAAGAQRGGVDKEEVSQAIAAAMGSLQDQQLARTREFNRLENWARDLDSSS